MELSHPHAVTVKASVATPGPVPSTTVVSSTWTLGGAHGPGAAATAAGAASPVTMAVATAAAPTSRSGDIPHPFALVRRDGPGCVPVYPRAVVAGLWRSDGNPS